MSDQEMGWKSLLRIFSSKELWYAFTALLGLFFIRCSQCFPAYSKPRSKILKKGTGVSTMVIWGSGGHTTEMICLLRGLPLENYQPIHHVLSNTDQTSRNKITKAELPFGGTGQWHQIVRSREVKQALISTVITTLLSSIQCLFLVLRLKPEVIICNGPGTCVPLCFSAFLLRFVGYNDTIIIFVESFCRVEKLSLTGKLLYPIVDRFIVQWPQLLTKYRRAEYLGDFISQGQ